MLILPQNYLKCVYKDVVDLFVRFDEKQSFSVGQNLVIFQKKTQKTQIFATFFLTPLFFRPETDKLPKKSHRPSQMTKMLAKNKFHDILIRIGAENQKF